MNHYDRGMSAFDGLFVPAELRDAVSRRAWLAAMLDAERALATPARPPGSCRQRLAAEIAAACDPGALRLRAARRRGPRGREPRRAARARPAGLGRRRGGAVRAPRRDEPGHHGYGRDARRAAGARARARRADARRVAAAALRRAMHRDTPMVGRTLLQQAVPTTFGLKAAGWLDRGRSRHAPGSAACREERPCRAARWRGRAPSPRSATEGIARRASSSPKSSASRRRRCPGTRTGCASPSSARHSRSPQVSLRRSALDLVLLAQTEVGEVAEAAARDGSSTMPQKRNPVGSTLRPRVCAARRGSCVRAHRLARAGARARRRRLAGRVGGALRRARATRAARCARSQTPSRDSRSTRHACARTSTCTGGLVLRRAGRRSCSPTGWAERRLRSRARGGAPRRRDELPRRAPRRRARGPRARGARRRARPDDVSRSQPRRSSTARSSATRSRRRQVVRDAAPRGRRAARGAAARALELARHDARDVGSAGGGRSPSGFRLVRYDRRGHGRSPVPPGPYPIDDLGADVLELLDALGLERVSFCGLSIGGMVGHVARVGGAGTDRPARPLLHGTASPAAEQWHERAAAVRADGVAAIADAVLARWFTPAFHAERPDVDRALPHDARRDARRGIRGLLRGDRGRSTSARGSASITAPTLVITGAEDPVAPPRAAAAACPGDLRAQRHVVVAGRRAYRERRATPSVHASAARSPDERRPQERRDTSDCTSAA